MHGSHVIAFGKFPLWFAPELVADPGTLVESGSSFSLNSQIKDYLKYITLLVPVTHIQKSNISFYIIDQVK